MAVMPFNKRVRSNDTVGISIGFSIIGWDGCYLVIGVLMVVVFVVLVVGVMVVVSLVVGEILSVAAFNCAIPDSRKPIPVSYNESMLGRYCVSMDKVLVVDEGTGLSSSVIAVDRSFEAITSGN